VTHLQVDGAPSVRLPMKPFSGCDETARKQTAGFIVAMGVRMNPTMESDMNAAIARIFPRASAQSTADIDAFVTIAIFSGLGLLISLSVVLLDQGIPGEWF
jgi:Ni/Fe-hydrogenase subunit HybB-like protein